MLSLMQQAQIHIVDSSITSGFKLKMISALFTARHIVARKVLVSKNLRKVIFTYSDRSEIATLILPLMQKPISDKEIATRRSVLLPGFSNEANAAKAIKFMFDDDATS